MGERASLIAKAPEVKKENSNSRMQKTTRSRSMGTSADSIRFLQRTVGNQAVSRLMKSGALQAKLRIGQPGDKYEQEADRVADVVMRMSEPGMQRQVEPEEEEEEELQTKAQPCHTLTVGPTTHAKIQSLKGGGQPLPDSARSFFEPRFGHDFSQVRLHSGGAAEKSARDVNADAYTVGHNIVFGAGQLSLGTQKGRLLLAHELAHVVQQLGSNRFHVGQVGEKRGLTPIAHTNQQTEQINREATTSPTLAAAAAVGTADITLETGNIGAGFLNNLVHQQICVDRYGPSRKRCFSFAAIGAQLPQFSSTWLGWNSWVIGAILEGQVYEPSPVSTATVVSRHTLTATQGNTWLNYILGTRLGLQDGYSVGRHNCRTYSQWEFRDAPSHW